VDELQVETLGVRTRAWQYGDAGGAPLVLVHGFRGDHHGLEGVARSLAERLPGVRAIVPDLPGFGATPPIPGRQHDLDLYGEWLRAFVAGAAGADDGGAGGGHAILGHSFGSLVVANAVAAGLGPSLAVLVNPISAPALEGPQAVLTKLAIGYYRAADALPERPARALLGHPAIVRTMSEVMAKTRDRELRRWIHGQHRDHFSDFSDTATLLQAFRASVSHTVAEYAAAFDMPTLIVAGERDDIAPLPAQLGLHHRVPGSRFRVLPGVGHLVHYETVADAADEIAAFLREEAGGIAAGAGAEAVAREAAAR
jgi:pimeloyl-ACP methyl ester carboxylesterase